MEKLFFIAAVKKEEDSGNKKLTFGARATKTAISRKICDFGFVYTRRLVIVIVLNFKIASSVAARKAGKKEAKQKDAFEFESQSRLHAIYDEGVLCFIQTMQTMKKYRSF